MARAKTIIVTKVKTPKLGSYKTKTNGKKKGNPNRCPSCGRFV